MKILYIHGFGSKYNERNPKVTSLKQLGDVVGLTVDYTTSPTENIEMLVEFAITAQVDLVVGTSMGGWAASHVGAQIGVPFVAINPATDPETTLSRHIGTNQDFNGNTYTLTESVVSEYTVLNRHGCGLVLLDSGDELFDSAVTKQELESSYSVITFEGGSHRFAHMDEALPIITEHYITAEVVYGLD